MRRFLPVLILSSLICAPALAEAPVYPFKLRAATKHVDVQADGSSVTTMHNEVELLDGAPVVQLSRQVVPYYEAVQDAVITEAYTLKPDGRRIAVDTKAIGTEPAGGADEPGRMQKVIPFANVAVGDTLVYTVLSRTSPTLDRGYMYGEVISPSLGRDDSQLTISVPKGMPLVHDSHGVVVVETQTWGGTTYSLRYAVRDPVSDANQFVARSDRERRFTFSSYQNYDELAAAYGKLVLDKIAVTPAIQALADQIAAGASGHRAIAERVHAWIAEHLVYTGVELGQGWYVPHTADAVLAAGRGDCKDHAVLFAALLKAKGIDAKYVLIDAGNGYTLSSAPDLSQFDHVIVWIPELKTYLDPTAHAAPFGVLPFAQYGKPVLHIGDSAALHTTPVLEMAASTLANRTVEKIDAQGVLSVTSGTTASGPASIALRSLGERVRSRPEDYLTGGLLVHRLTRASGAFDVPAAGGLSPNYGLSATYTTAPAPRLLSGDAIPRPDNVTTVPPAEQGFAGPIADPRFKDADPVACYGGQASDDLSFEFPASRRLAALPQNASIKTANVEYTSRWTLAGQVVKVHREYRSHFDQPLCNGPMLVSLRDALARIREDYRQELRLAPRTAAANQ